MFEEQTAREATVTDLAEAAVKGSSNTAGGEEIGAKKPEGYALIEERERGRRQKSRVKNVTERREFSPLVPLCISSHSSSYSFLD